MVYGFAEQVRDKAAAKVEALLNKVQDNDVIESLQEVLNLLNGIPDDKTLSQVIAGAINDALGDDGAITTAIKEAITAALGEDGDITTAITTTISTAIGTDGTIEKWADGRYEPKSQS